MIYKLYFNTYLIYTREFQEANERLTAHWDFSGDPCPIEKYEMAIHRVDGLVVSPMEELPKGNCYVCM